MSRLYLLRHARAAWPEPGMRDFDRALEAEGVADAQALGAAMRANGLKPHRVICSTARRARDTWSAVAQALDVPQDEASFSDALYSGDTTTYAQFLEQNGDTPSLMLVGHNPMLENMALALSADSADPARAALEFGFPACGLAVIAFDNGLENARPGTGKLEAFLTPHDL